MKKTLLFCLFVFFISEVFAEHIIGGEMRYEYIGPGSLPNTKQYRIRLLLLKGDASSGAALSTQYIVGIFNNDNNQKVIGNAGSTNNDNWWIVEDFGGTLFVPIISSPCILNAPTFNYVYKRYSFLADLPDNNTGYTVAFQTATRQNSATIPNGQGANYACTIPGLNVLPNPLFDNSPEYQLPISVICANTTFNLDFSVLDVDADSIAYAFCNAYNGGQATVADYRNPAPPPYGSVNYNPPYNGARPMGNGVTINSHTGIISGTAPNAGRYVVCVCASVYRNGVLISVHRKDLIVEVSGCIPLAANPDFNAVTCDGFNVTLTQATSGNPDIYEWDFGDPASGPANYSTVPVPTHTFSDTGVFYVKLKVTVLASNCVDSVIKPIGIYPSFFPGFINSATCVNAPVQFMDTTYFRYGTIVAWRWDFGDGATLADTSHLFNPVYTYSAPGNYNIRLIVTNDKGCIDTLDRNITVTANPVVSLISTDTAYCGLDSLQLNAGGAGSFNWTPAVNIINANTATPLVYPTTPTRYVVTLSDAFGCHAADSVLVTPKFDLSNSFTSSQLSICEEDTIQLSGSSNKTDNLNWQWSPAGSVENPTLQASRAWPATTTNYTLTTTWGAHCVVTASRQVNVKPLAVPNAGPDDALCNGQAAVHLSASGGDTYQWTPATGLNDPNIYNPVASPTVTTTYYVAVGVNGCPKTRLDSMVLTVRTLPAISTTNDTLICIIDTLQLNSTGTGSFVWTPNYMISNTSIANPLVSPDVATTYHVRLTDAFGCYREDSVRVDVRTSVTLNAGADTTVCQGDPFLLNPVSDGLYYQWTPSTYLNVDNVKHPVSTPLSTITYRVVASIGKCTNQDDVTITVVPYPIPNAGPDRSVCYDFPTQLNASGGSSYVWSPATFLTDRFVANPRVISPTANIQYIVTVRDNLGCPKPVKDTVWVYVARKVIADAGPRDTTAVLGQPLQLSASGADTYTWSPATWLSDASSQHPVALPQDDIRYTVTATTAQGCVGTDYINVKLYKVDPDLYVPTAFTPNGDTKNEILKPILLGMRELHYFRIYNRNGQLIYSTTQKDTGWDGTFKGNKQESGTYVWMAEGINYRGELRQKKGTTILLR